MKHVWLLYIIIDDSEPVDTTIHTFTDEALALRYAALHAGQQLNWSNFRTENTLTAASLYSVYLIMKKPINPVYTQ